MDKTLSKPYPSFPLSPHSSGYYCKRILGRMFYFGSRWGEPHDALLDYEFKRPYLEEGLEPPKDNHGVKLYEALDRFIIEQEKRVEQGKLSRGSWQDYKKASKQILAVIGRERSILGLLKTDFDRLHATLKGTPKTIEGYVARIKVGLRWIESNYDLKFNYGELQKPSAREIRQHRNKQPKKLFTPAELKLLIDAAPKRLKAQILMGINCGFGPMDCTTIEINHIEGNFHTHARPKTAVERRAYLWPITVEALKVVIADRVEGQVFLTKYRVPISSKARSSAISVAFHKLATKVGVDRTFYDLRRTFQTIADNSLDPVAVKAIMGHCDNSMSGIYRQLIPDERLIKVANVVLTWSKLDCES